VAWKVCIDPKQDRNEKGLQELGGQHHYDFLAHVREHPLQIGGDGQLTQTEHFITLVGELERMADCLGVARDFAHDQFGIRFNFEA